MLTIVADPEAAPAATVAVPDVSPIDEIGVPGILIRLATMISTFYR
jgi:hypothetical protein